MLVPKAQIEYEKVMIAEHGEEAWNRLSAERSICPDNKLAYNLWQRLNWVSRGSLNGLDALYKSSGICKKHIFKSIDKYCQGSGNSIFTEWASRLPVRMEVAIGHLLKLSP